MTTQLPETFRSLTIAAGIRAAAQRSPDKIALQHGDRTAKYRDFVDRMDRLTNATRTYWDLHSSDVAAIMSFNNVEYLQIVAGVSEAGVPVATLNPHLSQPEIERICADARVKLLFVDAAASEAMRTAELDSVEHIVEIGPTLDALLDSVDPSPVGGGAAEWDSFSIPYTSGTTGQPKGVLLPHRSRSVVFLAMASEYGCYSPDDRFLSFAPMSHGAGMAFSLAPIFVGGFVEIMQGFDPRAVLERLVENRMTGVFMVPTHFHSLFALGSDVLKQYSFPHLTTVISNAAPLPQSLKERIVGYFGEGMLHETYGFTEGGMVTNLRPADQLSKPGSVGMPFPAVRVRILDADGTDCPRGEVGELFANSPYLFNGYLNQPEETAAMMRDGWASAGDLARMDDEGYIYIVDRKKDMVISGGLNIYPREIEEVLFRHPAIADAAVIGVEDEKWGERLKAFLVVRPGESTDPAAVIDYCKQHLASFKAPKEVVFVDALPRNASGKVLKTELREQ